MLYWAMNLLEFALWCVSVVAIARGYLQYGLLVGLGLMVIAAGWLAGIRFVNRRIDRWYTERDEGQGKLF